MLSIGQKVPDFSFETFHNNRFRQVHLADYLGKWLVLLFYPADFTFVCPTELSEAEDKYAEFKQLGAEVISFSTDTVYAHKAWHDSSPVIGKITYPMGSDPSGQICRLVGSYLEAEGLSLRTTLIIDPDGVLKCLEMHDNSIGRSSTEILRKLQAAIFVRENKGEVCPASWHPGGKTLKPGIALVGNI